MLRPLSCICAWEQALKMFYLSIIVQYMKYVPVLWAATASLQVTQPADVHTPLHPGAATENERLAMAAVPLCKISW